MKKAFRNFLLFVASIFNLIFIIPLLLLLIIFPLILYRKFVIFLASCKKDIYLALNICSSPFGWDDMYRKPVFILCAVIYLKTGHDINHIICKLETVLKIVCNFFYYCEICRLKIRSIV